MTTILIVGEAPIVLALRAVLACQEFSVITVARTQAGLALLHSVPIDLVLLDATPPALDGAESCKQVRREFPFVPLVAVSEKANEEHLIDALNAGADDYIRQPFGVGELMARIRAAMRRNSWSAGEQGMLIAGDLRLDSADRSVEKRGIAIHLTARQCDILRFLMTNRDKPIGHGELLSAVWGKERADRVEYLRTFVRQIRMRIEDDPSRPQYLLTEPHFGYRFTIPSEQDSARSA